MKLTGPCFPNGSGSPAITTLHSDIINTHILPKLDGPTLASASCASSELHNLCSEENHWKNICNSAWPSTTDPQLQDIISTFPSGHRSFFADSFPTPDYNQKPKSKNKKICTRINPELLSAVDLNIGDQFQFSKILLKKDMPRWYTNSFLRIDLLDESEKQSMPIIKINGEKSDCIKFLEQEMKLSWIMIDPTRKHAVNLSSLEPVDVERHWIRKDFIQIRYAIVMGTNRVEGGFARFEATVICERKKEGELRVVRISMQVEDLEGKMMIGKHSLVLLFEAMDTRRVKRGEIDEEKKRYNKFLEMRGIYNRGIKQQRKNLKYKIWISLFFLSLFVTCLFIFVIRSIYMLL